jgi:DNA-binding CsgD family transcriptional regulator
VIGAELESIPHGSQRGRAFLLLAEGADVRTLDDYKDRLRDALVEAADDSWLHALVVAKMSSAVIEVERVADAEAAALSVLPAADRADVERAVLFALAWARALRGEAVDDLCERFERAADHDGYLAESPERVAAQRLVWRGDLAEARPRIERMLELADERGEPASYIWARLHLCELELRVGNADPAGRLLDEWAQGAEGEIFVMPVYQRCRALLAICRGSADEAVHWAVDAIASARQVGAQWDWLEGRRARGTALLFRGEAADAVADLNAVWRHAERQQLDEPGVFPVAAELVDALVETGTRVDAERVTERLRNMSERHAHPWGLITADRCGAVIRLAERYDEDAAAALQGSAARYGELGLHHDRARTLLVLGRTQRRHRKWAAARGSLEKAAEAFDGLAAPGWAAQARSELARVGGRRARTGGLTPAERRVAELASEGLSNKEIAAALFVTTKTVETHLSHAYAKLEVRSRAQLARKLGPG